jgi:hypothetical protein
MGEAVVGALALGGIMLGIGIAQWLVLRHQVPWAGRWVLAIAVGGAAGGAATFVLFEALSGTVGVVVGVVVGLGVFGIAQRLVLRRQVSKAAWLALASVVGLVAASLVAASSAVLAAAGPVVARVIGEVGLGAVYGAITGSALVWQLRQRPPASDRPSAVPS